MRAAPYDLIADIGGKLYRVQVKYIGPARTRVDVSKKGRKRRAYRPDEIDLLAVWQEPDNAYLIEWPPTAEHSWTITRERKVACQFEEVLAGILAERFAARSGGAAVGGAPGESTGGLDAGRQLESVPRE